MTIRGQILVSRTDDDPLPPRVWIQNVPVCTFKTSPCFNTCVRGAGTHGDVLNLHTEVFSACQAAPHTPRLAARKDPLCQEALEGLPWLCEWPKGPRGRPRHSCCTDLCSEGVSSPSPSSSVPFVARSTKTTDGCAPLGTVGIQVDLRRLGTIAGIRGTAAARARRRPRPVDDGRVPIVPTRTTRGEVIATVAVVP